MRKLAMGTATCLRAVLACVKGRPVERTGSGGQGRISGGACSPALPEGHALGQAAEVDVDSQNRVWVFHLADFTRE